MRHPPYDVVPIDTTMSTATGVLASATNASAEKGKLLAERISEHILGIIGSEFPG
jgi:creatinine amidohydrolase